jgi:hypothetical protein
VLKALQNALSTACPLLDESAVTNELLAPARETVGPMAKTELERWANHTLVSKIRIGGSPDVPSIARALKTQSVAPRSGLNNKRGYF